VPNSLESRGHLARVTCLAFSPDGRRLASGSEDLTVKVWETSGGQELLTLPGPGYFVTEVAFSPDGNRLAAADRAGNVKVWDGTPPAEPDDARVRTK
jgi:WD40 repeat protein